jgi:arylsulfatase A-like enzyme
LEDQCFRRITSHAGGDWKLHLNVRRGEKEELYDLAADPSESRNVAAEHPEVTQRLTKKLRAWIAELPTTYEKTGGGGQD